VAVKCVIGVDVGGLKKGLHVAILPIKESRITHLLHVRSAAQLWEVIQAQSLEVEVMAIDCPPKAQISGPKTRSSERELHAMGFRVQWTRRVTHEPEEWMQNGERFWSESRLLFPEAQLIETFPTAAAGQLSETKISMPLNLLADYHKQRLWKDFVDACICAEVGKRFLENACLKVGDEDELGPIYY